MKCKTCHKRVESMRTTDTGVMLMCEKCGRDLAPEDVMADVPERRLSASRQCDVVLSR